MARTRQSKPDPAAVNASILAALDIQAEYKSLGLDITGTATT